MASIKLTIKTLKGLKPEDGKQIDYFDRSLPGFGVRVSGKGKKSFVVLYRHAGRARRLTLGTYPALSLAHARELAREALRDAHLGDDPATRKREERRGESFADLSEAYLERYAKPKKKSWREDARIVHNKLVPAFGKLRAKDITRADVRAFLDVIAGRAPIEANRTLAVLRKMYNWGVSQDLVEHNPCHGVSRPGAERRRDRVLSDAEIRSVWDEVDIRTVFLVDGDRVISGRGHRGKKEQPPHET